MESWVSSNCTRYIYRPSTPEKEVNRKENTIGKTVKQATDRGRFESLCMLRYRFWRSSILFSAVLRQRKQGSFEQDLSCFLW